MNRRQLEYFLEVYKNGSIKKSAEVLMVSEQAVSKMIRNLEETLNLKLFVRNNNSLEPTKEAKYVANSATNILQEMDKLLVINKTNILPRKALTIYMTECVPEVLTYDFISEFISTYPGIVPNIIVGQNDNALEQLKLGNIELAILNILPNVLKYTSEELFETKYVAIVNKNNEMSKNTFLHNTDMKTQRVATNGRNFKWYLNNVAEMQKEGYSVDCILESNHNRLLINMAESNQAIAIVFDGAIKNVQLKNSVVKQLEGFGTYKHYLVCEKGKDLSNEAKCFRKFLIDWVKTNNI